MNELLGYDARFLPARQPREEVEGVQYFRKPGVIPLSIDRLVWPSPLDSVSDSEIFTNWGLHPPLWASFEKLANYCSLKLGDGNLVYLSVYRASASDDLQRYLTEEWSLLGFDVADEGFISGLSNCGHHGSYEDAGRWAPHLNRHHLFNDSSIAMEFKAYVDGEVTEHAPFFVYALCTLQSQARSV